MNMMRKMMDPNLIGNYITDYKIPSLTTIEYRYQLDFGNPGPGEN